MSSEQESEGHAQSKNEASETEQITRLLDGSGVADEGATVPKPPRNFSRHGPRPVARSNESSSSSQRDQSPMPATPIATALTTPSTSSSPSKPSAPLSSSTSNSQASSEDTPDNIEKYKDVTQEGGSLKRTALVQGAETTANGSFLQPVLPQSRLQLPRLLRVQPPSLLEIQRDRSPGPIRTPASVRELGSDYSRYPNPFSDSRASSFGGRTPVSGAQTPVPRQGSSAPSFISNPFEISMESFARSIADSADGVNSERRGLLTSSSALSIPAYFDDHLGSSPYLMDRTHPFTFPMYTDEKEDDDDMHMPTADDDMRYKASLRDHFNRTNICSTLGLAIMTMGLMFVFVLFPILTYTGSVSFLWAYETPLDQMPGYAKPEPWAIVNNLKYPLLQNVRSNLIDKDTPKEAYTRKSFDGSTLQLVFSDEFNDPNRTFYEGDDPYWFAGDFWYGATQDIDWYDPDAVTTWDGALELRLDKLHNHNLDFRSGMLNSWNQLCFKGGAFEVSISLPGPAGVMGLWPGAWTMGNLGRPGYLSTTDGMWPYTYSECDVGITPNQSSTDGLSELPGQRLSACTCDGEDHPTPGTGRGAPEIDILEASASYQVPGLGIMTQSFQVAPFDPWYYPDYEYMSFPVQHFSYPNTYTGGPFQQAVSGTTTLNNAWYDGEEYQRYAFEYRPGTGEGSWISWYVGDDVMFTMDGRAIRANGNVGPRQVSEEPMSMILNLGFSNNWVAIDWEHLKFPAVMRVDYVRLYQPEGETMVTCDPPGYETTDYIANHMEAYTNPNLTHWDQTPYSWPKHKLNTENCPTSFDDS